MAISDEAVYALNSKMGRVANKFGLGQLIRDAETSESVDIAGCVLLAGRAGGQIINGDTAASGVLSLHSTSNSTKGYVQIDDGSGLIIAPTTAVANLFKIGLPIFGVAFDDDNDQNAPFLMAYSGDQGNGPEIDWSSNRGTYTTPAFLQAGDGLLSFYIGTYDGTSFDGTNAARFHVTAVENFSAGHFGCEFQFWTKTIGTNTMVERLAISSAGIQILANNFLKIFDNSGSHYTAIHSAATATSTDYTLPAAAPVSNGQALVSTTLGIMSWASVMTNPMTTTGDIIYSSDNTGTPARLGIGTAQQVLTGGSIPAWGQMPQNYKNSSSSPGVAQTLSTGSSPVQFYTPSASINVKVDNSFLAGQRVTIVNLSSANTITLIANDNTVIRTIYPSTTGEVTANINAPATGINWSGITSIVSNYASYTPTFGGFGTVTNISMQWSRIGSKLFVRGTFKSGTIPATTAATMSLPAGLSIDLAGTIVEGNNRIGIAIQSTPTVQGVFSPTDAAGIAVISDTSDATKVFFSYQTDTTASDEAIAKQNSDAFAGSTTRFVIDFYVDIIGWSATAG